MKPTRSNQCCGQCIFFAATELEFQGGECRRRSPASAVGEEEEGEPVWPFMLENQWCGEWQSTALAPNAWKHDMREIAHADH